MEKQDTPPTNAQKNYKANDNRANTPRPVEVSEEKKQPPRRAAQLETREGMLLVSGRVEAEDWGGLDFEGSRLLTIRGRVLHQGKALAGVQIVGGSLGQAETDVNGYFMFREVEEGTLYSIKALKVGFHIECDEARRSLQDDVTLELIGKKLFSVSGRILRKGEGLSGVRVDAGELGSVFTNGQGVFVFQDVVEGSPYRIAATKDRYRIAGSNGAGVVTDNLKLEYEAVKLVTVSGQVTHRGTPLKGVEVSGGSLGKVLTDENGRYSFSEVPEGSEFRLSVTKAGFRFGRPRNGGVAANIQ